MSWEKETVLILVKAAPNWSTKHKQYEVCTAGISQTNGWRRLYPFPERNMIKKDVHVWDLIEVETTKPTDDPRPESRKIKLESIVKVDCLEDRKERKRFLEDMAEPSLDSAINEKRTMMLVRPSIEGFEIEQRLEEVDQTTLDGKVFKIRPYGDVGLYYKWRCPKPCEVCKARPHRMECFDWGANILYRRYSDPAEAELKTTQKCYYEMKYDNDTWFALGTHRAYPFLKWMVVGLLWMKKKLKSDRGE